MTAQAGRPGNGPALSPREVSSVARPLPDAAVAAVDRLLRALGVPGGEEVAGTPERVAASWRHALRGYGLDPARHLESTRPGTIEPGLIVAAGIRYRTHCAAHLAPVTGVATVAYRPVARARTVTTAAVARMVAECAARLTVQAALGQRVAGVVAAGLSVQGTACILTAVHTCDAPDGGAAARTTTVALAGGWGSDALDVRDAVAEHRAVVAAGGAW